MDYHRDELKKVAREALAAARENLRKHGHVQPVGLVFHQDGLTHVFQFTFQSIEEKRASQEAFRQVLRKVRARAAVVVTESWLKMETEMPPDLTRSIADDPTRKEAIVIAAVSRQARSMIIQVFRRDSSGKVRFDSPMEPESPFEWWSEWLDGVWPEREPKWST